MLLLFFVHPTDNVVYGTAEPL